MGYYEKNHARTVHYFNKNNLDKGSHTKHIDLVCIMKMMLYARVFTGSNLPHQGVPHVKKPWVDPSILLVQPRPLNNGNM